MDQEGCNVVVADINLEAAEKVASGLSNGAAFQVDVCNVQQVEEMVDFAVEKFGKLDLLVSNAAILIAKSVTDFTPEEWRKMIDVNLVGYFQAQSNSTSNDRTKSGNIIQINSKSGKEVPIKTCLYFFKIQWNGLTQSLALELAEYGVRVNAICQGWIAPVVNSLLRICKKPGYFRRRSKAKYLDSALGKKLPIRRYC